MPENRLAEHATTTAFCSPLVRHISSYPGATFNPHGKISMKKRHPLLPAAAEPAPGIRYDSCCSKCYMHLQVMRAIATRLATGGHTTATPSLPAMPHISRGCTAATLGGRDTAIRPIPAPQRNQEDEIFH